MVGADLRKSHYLNLIQFLRYRLKWTIGGYKLLDGNVWPNVCYFTITWICNIERSCNLRTEYWSEYVYSVVIAERFHSFNTVYHYILLNHRQGRHINFISTYPLNTDCNIELVCGYEHLNRTVWPVIYSGSGLFGVRYVVKNRFVWLMRFLLVIHFNLCLCPIFTIWSVLKEFITWLGWVKVRCCHYGTFPQLVHRIIILKPLSRESSS